MPRSKRTTPPDGRPVKITFGELREMGLRDVLIYCADYRCGHNTSVSAHFWADELRLSDVEPRFTCTACGRRGADVRPDFDTGQPPLALAAHRRNNAP
nr:hypothetical protein [Bradyrhizobium guangxiense]